MCLRDETLFLQHVQRELLKQRVVHLSLVEVEEQVGVERRDQQVVFVGQLVRIRFVKHFLLKQLLRLEAAD